MEHSFAPWRNVGSCYQIPIFRPRASRPFFFFFSGFNSHYLWRWIRLKGSHLQKGRKPKENIFWERATVPATAQKGGRAAEDDVSRSIGVWVGKGGRSRAMGLLFPCAGAQCLCTEWVVVVVGGQHNHAVEMGPTGMHASVPGNISFLDQAFRLPCLVPCVAHGWPGRKKILISSQAFSVSSRLQLRN